MRVQRGRDQPVVVYGSNQHKHLPQQAITTKPTTSADILARSGPDPAATRSQILPYVQPKYATAQPGLQPSPNVRVTEQWSSAVVQRQPCSMFLHHLVEPPTSPAPAGADHASVRSEPDALLLTIDHTYAATASPAEDVEPTRQVVWCTSSKVQWSASTEPTPTLSPGPAPTTTTQQQQPSANDILLPVAQPVSALTVRESQAVPDISQFHMPSAAWEERIVAPRVPRLLSGLSADPDDLHALLPPRSAIPETAAGQHSESSVSAILARMQARLHSASSALHSTAEHRVFQSRAACGTPRQCHTDPTVDMAKPCHSEVLWRDPQLDHNNIWMP